MILFFAVALGAAVAVVVSRRHGTGACGWFWFWMWAAASALFVFALATGLSIGLFVAPVAIAMFIWVADKAPQGAELLGGLTGFGIDLALFGTLHDWRSGTIAGAAAVVGGICGYTSALTRRERSTSPPATS